MSKKSKVVKKWRKVGTPPRLPINTQAQLEVAEQIYDIVLGQLKKDMVETVIREKDNEFAELDRFRQSLNAMKIEIREQFNKRYLESDI